MFAAYCQWVRICIITLISGVLCALLACGGSGGGGPNNFVPDLTPPPDSEPGGGDAIPPIAMPSPSIDIVPDPHVVKLLLTLDAHGVYVSSAGTFIVDGSVVKQNGVAFAGATVTLNNQQSGVIQIAQTQVDGAFHEPIAAAPGDVIAERYEVIHMLGRGAMGAVMQAHDRKHNTTVALKMLLDSVDEALRPVQRFMREAQTLSRLNHPNIVKVLDVITTPEGVSCLVMEYIDGTPLYRMMQRNPRGLWVGYVLDISMQLLAALDAAHTQGVFHRDLKPGNILVMQHHGQHDRVKVIDFGIAKIAPSHEEVQLTRAGLVLGSPNDLSPEQARGKPVTAQSDLYSLGMVMYEMLAGRTPFREFQPTGEQSTGMEMLAAHIHESPPPLQELRQDPDLSAGLVALVHQALAKNPHDRPPSAAHMRRSIASIQAAPSAKAS